MRVLRDLVGETLGGRYHLIARVAGGGMGEIYRGHDLLLDRVVAVKVLQPSLAADPALVERFKQEARAAARLTHPNVVAVYDWGSDDERTYYMVMEFVSGTDLRNVLVERGSLPPSQAVEIVAFVCDALAAAHGTGLVHRDVKPENVLIARTGAVKVADFGIAAVVDVDLTSPGGMVPGTLRYLSPEQAAGREATAASDIWAAGALLGELVTGIPPALGTGPDLFHKRAHEPPNPPSARDGRVPKEIDRVVLRACAVGAEDRYVSAADMAAELRRARDHLKDGPPLEELVSDGTGEIRLPELEPTRFRRARERKRSIPVRVAFAVLALLALVGGARAAVTVFGPQEVRVPELVGLMAESAEIEAADAGFDVEVVERVPDPGMAPPGEVIEQDPATGLLREGSTIAIVVSRGPPKIGVPTLVGIPLATARVRLAAYQLEEGEITRRFSIEPSGTVIEQSVSGRAVDWGTAIDLVVSRGPRDIEVPDVTGRTVKRARQILEAAGFTTTVVAVYSNNVPAGEVVGTTPSAGEMAPEGSEIEIARSRGPRYEEVRVPDVRNMTVARARARLEALNLRVVVRDVNEEGCGDDGTVAETEPLPGTVVRENDLIELFVVC
ncbi:MAG: PASTA domain-containing protein [Actinomycetota bacterium]|nr:PASTA domain-containing protein [Actinomycetota bacterium]